ncbi:MAG: PHB depolymerase family esterase [bacterium]|nr:PHB depolymerase family esterase [bacterium]
MPHTKLVIFAVFSAVLIGSIHFLKFRESNRENPLSVSIAAESQAQKTTGTDSVGLPVKNSQNNGGKPSYPSGSYSRILKTADGLTRSYLIHIPAGYDSKKEYSLVIALHGGFGSGESMEKQTRMSALADKDGFIVVYPDGVANSNGVRAWNAGNCCGVPAKNNVDDVGYIRQLMASLESTYGVDVKRVFAMGMSNGAMLANRLACEASDIFTAVSPVSGTPQVAVCNPKRPVPILMVHGTSDAVVPFNGGTGTSFVTKDNSFISVTQALSDWSVRNKCLGKEVVTSIPPLTNDGITIDKIMYSDCAAETVLYRINGGTHSWPGGTQARAQESVAPSQSFDASKTIWTFFNSF